MAPEQHNLQLPVSIVGLIDVGRVLREVEHLEGVMQSQAIRSEGHAVAGSPQVSQLLDETIQLNRLDMTNHAHRQQLHAFLLDVKKSAPKVHMSFSANPSTRFIAELTTWLRKNIHPLVLVAIGLQPGIGAGCVLRTTNKYFDMSLSKSFGDSRAILMKYLRDPNIGLAPSAATGQAAPAAVVLPPTQTPGVAA